MLHLAIIYHMHQPYYKDLATGEFHFPWVRLHGTKDYLDMVKILEQFPKIHLTFNFVPSLLEQILDYTQTPLDQIDERFLSLSLKKVADLKSEEKDFLLMNFFSINAEKVISNIPRYYELYLKARLPRNFTTQDYLDLQVWFNLAWIDPLFRRADSELNKLVKKGRFFTEEEKKTLLEIQMQILKEIIPTYKKFQENQQIEIAVSPYFHPILPLVYNTKIAKEANLKSPLPKTNFSFPQDAKWQIEEAVKYFASIFGIKPKGMWPSEEAVSEHILPLIMQSDINWLVTDEAILFKSLKKKRSARLLYKPYVLRHNEGQLNIIFRDRNLSDLISFVYHRLKPQEAVNDFMGHLHNINKTLSDNNAIVTVALDGENAWEYYSNDGIDFLTMLYQAISSDPQIKTVTVSDFLKCNCPSREISRLASGSWINADFSKWIGLKEKVLFWEYLAQARKLLDSRADVSHLGRACRQMYILEGSDWFWWAGENNPEFDRLFKRHMTNFYHFINKELPSWLQ